MGREDLTDFYRQRGLAGRVGFGERPAVVVVDMIHGFTDPASPLGANLDAEIAATARLLAAARAARVPVHFTSIEFQDDGSGGGPFVAKIPAIRTLRPGTRLVAVDERLAPRGSEPLWKKRGASAFFGTALAAALTESRVDTVLLAGCTTSGCVRASAVDSCQHGFRTIVVCEAVGDRARDPHEANLFDMDAKYADVVGLDEVLAYLAARPESPPL
jgi:nicotinamidase-related amidase